MEEENTTLNKKIKQKNTILTRPENLDTIFGYSELNNMNDIDIDERTFRRDLGSCSISKIENLEEAYTLEYIYLENNNIDTIENLETIPSRYIKDHGELWIGESVKYITQESYDYLKANLGVEVFFEPEGSGVNNKYVGSRKKIDDLEIV